MRFLIQNIGSAEWMGGAQYLRNLMTAVKEFDPTQTFLSFGPGENIEPVSEQGLLDKAYYLMEQEKKSFATYLESRSRLQKFKDFFYGTSSALKTHDDLKAIEKKRELQEKAKLFDVSYLVEDSSITSLKPNLQWIADFQHFVEPKFFLQDEIESRNRQFIKKISEATLVVVSSESAKKDLYRFCEAFKLSGKEKARVLHFATPMNEFARVVHVEQVIAKYHLPQKFFLLPNQFWMHKNHYVVIDALAIAIQKFSDICVVMTGNTHDYRHPHYFQSVMQKISLAGLSDKIRILGMVPLVDLHALMLKAHAFINPSFFEGWSTSVEEAKVLQKRLILSDIEVHREQNPRLAKFFNPRSDDELAAALGEVWTESVPSDAQNLEAITSTSRELGKQFAESFLKIANESIQLWQKEH